MDSRLIEELTLNAWPPLETLLFDGWILSFSHGYTRRANSVHPLYRSTLDLASKIAHCEATYAARGRDTTFKITSSAADTEIDRALADRGYALAAPTSVQIADISALGTASTSAQTASLAALATTPSDGVALSTRLSDAWFADFNRLTVTPESLHQAERRLLEQIVPPCAFASIALNGETVAVGLAVAERGYVGLFDIVVDARVRNQGLARRLCQSLLQWGTSEGATTAYLAVMQDNAPALHLYQTLGFRKVYSYWYRHASQAC